MNGGKLNTCWLFFLVSQLTLGPNLNMSFKLSLYPYPAHFSMSLSLSAVRTSALSSLNTNFNSSKILNSFHGNQKISFLRKVSPLASLSKSDCSEENVTSSDVGRRSIITKTILSASIISSPLLFTNFLFPENANAAVCELKETSTGLAYCDTVVGDGLIAESGMIIKAHYSGRLENGTVFDSSYKRGSPLVFQVGIGQVIKGWDQGIVGNDEIPPMAIGGKRTLKIPSELAYGARGAGCRGGSCAIPPNSVLFFDVEFVGKAK